MLVIGSHALNKAAGYRVRSPKDVDIVCTYEEFEGYLNDLKQKEWPRITAVYPENSGKKMIVRFVDEKVYMPMEFEIAWEGSTAEQILRLAEGDQIASLDLLYTLKMTHRYKKNSPYFKKTMDDILLMREHGAKIRPEYMDFFKAREKETYNYKHPNLNQNKDGFFNKNEGVKYIYDHDTIHQAVKFLDRPAYELYKDDAKEVMCSKEKFFQVDEIVRLYGCLEEAFTLALERSIIPFPGVLTPRQAFDMALQKVASSITSGYFREYCWDNFYKLQAMYSMYDEEGINYVDRFWKGVEDGTVRKL